MANLVQRLNTNWLSVSVRTARWASAVAKGARRARASSTGAARKPPVKPQPSNFNDLKLCQDVRNALERLKIKQPTPIQALAIPSICSGENVLCAAETGSGKTLAYMIPLVNRLRTEETEMGVVTRLHRPRAVVIVPTSELARQVLKVVKDLANKAPVRAMGMYGGQKAKRVDEHLENAADIIIATPGLLSRYIDKGKVFLSDVVYAVVDEADSMFQEGFADEVFRILKPLTERREPKEATHTTLKLHADGLLVSTPPAQIVVATATVTKPFLKTLQTAFPDMKRITSPVLHKCGDNVNHSFVRIKGHDDSKQNALVNLLAKRSPNEKVMVFCNTHTTVDWASATLRDNGVSNIKLHSSMLAAERKSAYDLFKKIEGGVLVCSDIASRGLDTIDVGHVVMFDFPKTVTDYLHRAGRTGRIGTRGIVTAFYSTKNAELAHRVEMAVTKDHTLGNLFKEMAVPEEYGHAKKTTAPAFGVQPVLKVLRAVQPRVSTSKSSPAAAEFGVQSVPKAVRPRVSTSKSRPAADFAVQPVSKDGRAAQSPVSTSRSRPPAKRSRPPKDGIRSGPQSKPIVQHRKKT